MKKYNFTNNMPETEVSPAKNLQTCTVIWDNLFKQNHRFLCVLFLIEFQTTTSICN